MVSLWGHHHGGELLQAGGVPALGTKTAARGLLSTPGRGDTRPHSGCPGTGHRWARGHRTHRAISQCDIP